MSDRADARAAAGRRPPDRRARARRRASAPSATPDGPGAAACRRGVGAAACSSTSRDRPASGSARGCAGRCAPRLAARERWRGESRARDGALGASRDAGGAPAATRARVAGAAPPLPESPQHRAWRARATAAAREQRAICAGRFARGARRRPAPARAAIRRRALGEWFELGERLRADCRRVGSASHCLHEWPEPDDCARRRRARPPRSAEPGGRARRERAARVRARAAERPPVEGLARLGGRARGAGARALPRHPAMLGDHAQGMAARGVGARAADELRAVASSRSSGCGQRDAVDAGGRMTGAASAAKVRSAAPKRSPQQVGAAVGEQLGDVVELAPHHRPRPRPRRPGGSPARAR